MDLDDFQSPAQPRTYIELRIATAMSFYKKRIPIYNWVGIFLNCSILLFGVAASVLAYYEEITYVILTTGAAVGVTSWIEFIDYTSKAERYTYPNCY